jgi:hypothetical protein
MTTPTQKNDETSPSAAQSPAATLDELARLKRANRVLTVGVLAALIIALAVLLRPQKAPERLVQIQNEHSSPSVAAQPKETAAEEPDPTPRRPPNVFDMAIMPKIREEVGRQLREAGAACDDLLVTTDVKEWNHRVSYYGLRNFKHTNDSKPDPRWPANGTFSMSSINDHQSQGTLGGRTFAVQYGKTDNVELPFVNDPQVIGEWEGVDFVNSQDGFDPDERHWNRDLYFKGLVCLDGGKIRSRANWPQFTSWTKGALIAKSDRTVSHYELREIKGQVYMFFEWKSGDVTILGRDPQYYVLRRRSQAGTPAVPKTEAPPPNQNNF